MDDIAAVEAYFDGLSEPHRGLLAHVRAVVRDACPEATEAIYYRMPGFRVRGKLLLSYAAHRKHCSIYPASGMVRATLGEELAPYLAAKATIRFTAEDPIPDELVRRIVAVRVEEGTAPKGGR